MQSIRDIGRLAAELVLVWAATVRAAKKIIEKILELFILPKNAVVRAASINSMSRPKLRSCRSRPTTDAPANPKVTDQLIRRCTRPSRRRRHVFNSGVLFKERQHL